MNQFYLDDERWALIASSLPGKDGDPGRHGRDNRLFLEAVLWIVRTDSPWRKLPPQFGHWYTAYIRFKRWTLLNVWPEVFAKLAQDARCEYFYENGAIFYAPLNTRRACLPRLKAFSADEIRPPRAAAGKTEPSAFSQLETAPQIYSFD